jgi:hypothetical protein
MVSALGGICDAVPRLRPWPAVRRGDLQLLVGSPGRQITANFNVPAAIAQSRRKLIGGGGHWTLDTVGDFSSMKGGSAAGGILSPVLKHAAA